MRRRRSPVGDSGAHHGGCGFVWPLSLLPQQTTLLSARRPQLCPPPAETVRNLLASVCPYWSLPQQVIDPFSVRAQPK